MSKINDLDRDIALLNLPAYYEGFIHRLKLKDERLPGLIEEYEETGGSDYSETWAVFMPIAKFIVVKLDLFLKYVRSYPINLENQQEWIKTIKKIREAFNILYEDDWTEWSKKDLKKIEKGLKLFTEHFRSLWW